MESESLKDQAKYLTEEKDRDSKPPEEEEEFKDDASGNTGCWRSLELVSF